MRRLREPPSLHSVYHVRRAGGRPTRCWICKVDAAVPESWKWDGCLSAEAKRRRSDVKERNGRTLHEHGGKVKDHLLALSS